MRRFRPTIWLSFGLVCLTLALALVGFALGLMPDGQKAELISRAKVAESLAVQLAGAANRNDNTTVQETLTSVVERNEDVLSSALRRADGEIILSAGDHEKNWVKTPDGKSTPTHVSVPLYGPNGLQGTIELSFGPATSGKRILGIPATLLAFLGFLTGGGFIGYFILLRRALHQLDPGRVIPERVQKAFDTLSEGVIIVDEKERILLVNSAFAEFYGAKHVPGLGSKINTLSWRMVDGRAQAGGYPWHTAIREGRETRQDFLSLRTVDGRIHNFNVNATVIADEKNKTIGAIVTLSDMTALNRQKDNYNKTAERLSLAEEQIEHQSNELAYLASHDSLTDCLNRRAFIQQLESDMEAFGDQREKISLLIVDMDHFSRLNDHHGPATGDRIVKGVAEIFRGVMGTGGFIGRYSGDQFAIFLPGADISHAEALGEKIRSAVAESSRKLLPGGSNLTVSIGLAEGEGDGIAAQILLNRASQASRVAKARGRDRLVSWSQTLERPETAAQAALHQAHLTPHLPQANGQSGDSTAPMAELSRPVAKTTIDHEVPSTGTDLSVFLAATERAITRANASGKQSAIIQISVQSFDYLAEALGEKDSNTLLRTIRRRLVLGLREQDEVLVIANTGEIMVNIAETSGRKELTWTVQNLLDSLHTHFTIAGQEIFLACKAGIALFPDDGGAPTILARNAGIAMRRARDESTTQNYLFHSADMVLTSQERLNIESGIRQALQRNEFELYFQPIVDMKSGALAAAESLLRCNNQQLTGIPMDKVIDVAEKSSLIGEIDLWVLNCALRQMQAWDDAGITLPKISINISATQFTNIAFMDTVFETIKAVRFSPSRVQIEVTETARMTDVDIAAPQLKRLQQLGVLIALDDFGTGQASLTYLQRLHPDVIKIDRSFITAVHTNHANATLVSAMTVMAHCLGLKVVVEGVEDEDEFEFLRETRCDEMQGYFISKPMPSSVMGNWMTLFVREKGAIRSLDNPVRPLKQQSAVHGDDEPLKVDAA